MSSSPPEWISSPDREKGEEAVHEEGDETTSGGGRTRRRDAEFCPVMTKGLAAGAGDAGKVGEDDEGGRNPRSLRALRTTEWRSVSGPKAKRIISFSPWSWINRSPIILAAFSGSILCILENTILVASYASMAEEQLTKFVPFFSFFQLSLKMEEKGMHVSYRCDLKKKKNKRRKRERRKGMREEKKR